MKNRDYWNWLEVQPDNVKKEIIEKSPWYNIEGGTPVWLNRLVTKRCNVEIDGHIYRSELYAESEKYSWGYSSWVNDKQYYSIGTIKEQFEQCYSKKGLSFEIEIFRRTFENMHNSIAIQLLGCEDPDFKPADDSFLEPRPLTSNVYKSHARVIHVHPVWVCDYRHMPVSFMDGNINYKWKPTDVFLSLEPLTEKEIIKAFN